MSHEIMKTEDGTFAMAYREGDALPWHRRRQIRKPSPAPLRRRLLVMPPGWDIRFSLSPTAARMVRRLRTLSIYHGRTIRPRCSGGSLPETGNPCKILTC
jgi:hypothetical protein